MRNRPMTGQTPSEKSKAQKCQLGVAARLSPRKLKSMGISLSEMPANWSKLAVMNSDW